jgi:phage FluMu gp28-like protein
MSQIPYSALADQAVQDSVIHFDRSQRALFEDPARVVGVNFHRQKGKDFVAAGKAFNEGCANGSDWWIVGMTQAQADETFNKVKKFAAASRELLKRMFGTDEVREEKENFLDYDSEIKHMFECTARIMRLPNGARIVSLPGKNPDSLAGRTGNMIWTEFGLYPFGGYKHWDVLFPIITRGGYKLIMISTPRGKNTRFYDVMSNRDGLYSTHTCNIYTSVFEEGYQLYDLKTGEPFPMRTREEQEIALATFRKAYNSEGKWAREYGCEFSGDLSALVPWSQLERAGQLGANLPFDWLRVEKSGRPLGAIWEALKALAREGWRPEVGWDVARVNHISALTLNLAKHNQPKWLRFIVGMHDLPFEDQRAFGRACMELARSSVGAGDATGLGRESNEAMEKLYKERWIPFQFSSQGKRDVASALSTAFSDGTQTLPPLDGPYKFVATDIYAVQKDDTGAQLELDETDNPLLPESHCDIAYSLGMNRVAGARNGRAPRHAPLEEVPLGW